MTTPPPPSRTASPTPDAEACEHCTCADGQDMPEGEDFMRAYFRPGLISGPD